MNRYPVGTSVEVTFALDAGQPTGLSYSVLGHDESVIHGPVAVTPTPGMTSLEVIVTGAQNGPVTLPYEVRSVKLDVTTATDVYQLEQVYLLERLNRLDLLENTFQTLRQAHATAAMIPNLPGWETANDSDRTAAMAEAFQRLTRCGYRVRRPEDVDSQSILDPTVVEIIEPRNWPLIDAAIWNGPRYPKTFKDALRRAQILEANQILSGDRINDRRRAGIMSETIGESSMMFRMDKPLDLGLSDAALRALTGFIHIRYTLARA